MLNLIIGKAKTGKSKYIMDKIDECVRAGKDVTLFIPSQMRMLAEEKYIACQNKTGIINIDFTTISSFVRSYNEKHNITKDKSYISKMDQKVILSKVVEENDSIFNVFKKCKNLSGFVSTMQIYMDLISKNSKLRDKSLGKNIDDDVITSSKLNEIILLYEKYEVMKESMGLIDSSDDISIFIDNFFLDDESISKSCIFFDSYNNFSESELMFIEKLLKMGFEVNISVASNLLEYVYDSPYELLDVESIKEKISLDESDIFYLYNLTVLKLIKMAKSLNVGIRINEGLGNNTEKIDENIRFLSENIFSTNFNLEGRNKKVSNIDIVFTTNVYTQFEAISDDIISKVKNDEARFSDFCIYTSCVPEIKNIVDNIFIKHKIPIHVDMEYRLTDFVIYKYIYYLLSMCVEGINYNNLFNLLKLNMLDISLDDISIFENYCLEYNITEEYRFMLDIKENDDYDMDLLRMFKKKVIDTYISFKKDIISKKSAKDIVQAIYKHLDENNILDKLKNLTCDMENSDDTKIKYYASLNKPLLDSLCEVLDSILRVYGNESHINIRSFFKVFKLVSSDITKKGVPETIDEVQLLDINVSKTSPKKYVYFVKVNENSMPLGAKEDIIFSDRDIKTLEKRFNIKFKESSISKLAMQNYNIYEAILSAKEKISFYYLASDIDGSSLSKSSLISSIHDILDVKEKIYEKSLALTKENLAQELNSRIFSDGVIDEETIAIYESLNETSDFISALNYSRNDKNLSKDSLNKMYPKDENIVSSVSKIEQFKRCPFSYFMKYGLNLKERKVYKITSLDLGSFMHNVLEKFSKYLVYENISWNMVLENDKCTEVLDDIIEEILGKNLSKHKDSIKYHVLKRKLKKSMKNAVNVIARGFVQSEFKPYAYELEFSDYSEYKPLEIKISEDKSVKLIGKIDRVDIAKAYDCTYVRIVDYKSSSKDLTIDDIKEGISLQLMTYMSAFMQNFKDGKIKPAGVMYFNLSDKLLKLNGYIKDEEKVEAKIMESLRMKGIFLSDIKILEIMDKKLESKERVINVSARTVQSNKKSKSLLDEEQFGAIITDIRDILKDILNNIIIEGNVKIEPNLNVDPCKYCVYGSICRKNNMC